MTTPPPEPGQPRLDRAPGERYRAASTATGTAGPSGRPEPLPWTRRRRVALCVAVAVIGGVLVLILGGLDLGAGLIVVAATAGWLGGLLLAGGSAPGRGPDAGVRRGVAAALIAGGGIALGFVADGLRALSEGGVLSPVDYASERYGPLALVVIVAAIVAGLLRGR